MDCVGECLHNKHSPVGRGQGFVRGIRCKIKGSDRWIRFLTHKAVLTCTLPCRRQLLLISLSNFLDTQQPNLLKAEGARLMWAWMSSSIRQSTYCWGSKTSWQQSEVYLSWMINHVLGLWLPHVPKCWIAQEPVHILHPSPPLPLWMRGTAGNQQVHMPAYFIQSVLGRQSCDGLGTCHTSSVKTH